MLSQQEICFITLQVGMMFYVFQSNRMNSSLLRNFLPVSFFREIQFLFPVHFQQV